MGAGNSAVVVDVARCGPMLSPRVPNLVPIPGPGMERVNPWSAPTTKLWAPTRPGLPTGCDCLLYHPMKKNDQRRCENIALLISRSHSALA